MLPQKTRIVTISLLCVLLPAVPALAGSGLAGPIPGLIFDSATKALRPVLGVPGASHLGDALASSLDWATVAPSGRSAVGLADGQMCLLRLGTDGVRWISLAEQSVPPLRVAWSADSGTVALYWKETGVVQLWRDLNSTPRAGTQVDLSGLQGEVSSLAVVNNGDTVVIGLTSSPASGVYVSAAGEAPRLQIPLPDPVAILPAPGGRNLFVADRSTKQVIEIIDFETAAVVTPLTEQEDCQISDPVGLALSPDGRKLFVADSAARKITVLDPETRTLVSRLDLDFSPDFLQPFSEQSLFLLKEGRQGLQPYEILDASTVPVVYFIPAGANVGEGE